MSKINLEHEFDAFVELFKDHLVEGQHRFTVVPETPLEAEPFTVGFELIDTSSQTENRAMVRKDRTYQLVFFFDTLTQAALTHGYVEEMFEELLSIPCSDRHIKFDSFAVSRVFDIRNNKKAFSVIIEAYYFNPRTFADVPLMTAVNAAITKQ